MSGKKGRKRDCRLEASQGIYKTIKEISGKDLTRVAVLRIILAWKIFQKQTLRRRFKCKKFL